MAEQIVHIDWVGPYSPEKVSDQSEELNEPLSSLWHLSFIQRTIPSSKVPVFLIGTGFNYTSIDLFYKKQWTTNNTLSNSGLIV